MGELAAETLLKRIRGSEYHKVIAVEPELIVRESTAPAPIESLEGFEEIVGSDSRKTR